MSESKSEFESEWERLQKEWFDLEAMHIKDPFAGLELKVVVAYKVYLVHISGVSKT